MANAKSTQLELFGQPQPKYNPREYQKARRVRLSLEGLCCRCGKAPPVAGNVLCQDCQEHVNGNRRRRRLLLGAQAMCGCGRSQLLPGRKLCADCIRKDQARSTQRRQERAAANLCQCGKEKENGQWCSECSQRCKVWNLRRRREAIDHYGGLCVSCKEEEIEFLTFDHINGGGGRHRKEIGAHGGGKFANWLRKNGWPSGYQILCYNCNIDKKNQEMARRPKSENRLAVSNRLYHQKIRVEVIQSYGGFLCACCGFDKPDLLTLDHIYGNGAEERRSVGNGLQLFLHLKRNGFPGGYQVLCFNCNCAKGTGPVCPHRLKGQACETR